MTSRGSSPISRAFQQTTAPASAPPFFLKGCALRCPWCHNPETLFPAPQLLFYPQRCLHCGRCVSRCPRHCHTDDESGHTFQRAVCTACGSCVSVCPAEALVMAGKEVRVGGGHVPDHGRQTVLRPVWWGTQPVRRGTAAASGFLRGARQTMLLRGDPHPGRHLRLCPIQPVRGSTAICTRVLRGSQMPGRSGLSPPYRRQPHHRPRQPAPVIGRRGGYYRPHSHHSTCQRHP